jgi:hypothetical protein
MLYDFMTGWNRRKSKLGVGALRGVEICNIILAEASGSATLTWNSIRARFPCLKSAWVSLLLLPYYVTTGSSAYCNQWFAIQLLNTNG